MSQATEVYERKYAEVVTLYFPLIDRGTLDFESTPVAHAAGDTQVSIDGGAFVNTTNAFAHEGNGIYSLALTVAEVTGKVIMVTLIDQSGPKLWEDLALRIETYGNASALHQVDRDVGVSVFDELEGTQPAAAPGNSESFRAILQYVKRRFTNKVTQTATTKTVFKDDSAATLFTQTHAFDGTTQTQGKGA